MVIHRLLRRCRPADVVLLLPVVRVKGALTLRQQRAGLPPDLTSRASRVVADR